MPIHIDRTCSTIPEDFYLICLVCDSDSVSVYLLLNINYYINT